MDKKEIETILAEIIIESIRQAITEAFASLDGGDEQYYKELFLDLKQECEKIAEMSGLPLDVVEKIATLIGKNAAAEIAKELVISDFQYNVQNDRKKSNWEDSKKSTERERSQEKERDKEDEIDENQEEHEQQEDRDASTLAKLAELRQKKQTKEVLKSLLFSMIASRMDPRQRAGETASANVKHAEIYGRQNLLSIGQLVKAGVISAVGLKQLHSLGIGQNMQVSLNKVQDIVRGSSGGLFALVQGLGQVAADTLTKIPSKGNGLFVIENVNKSMGIFNSTATDLAKENAREMGPDATPINQKDSQGRGR